MGSEKDMLLACAPDVRAEIVRQSLRTPCSVAALARACTGLRRELGPTLSALRVCSRFTDIDRGGAATVDSSSLAQRLPLSDGDCAALTRVLLTTEAMPHLAFVKLGDCSGVSFAAVCDLIRTHACVRSKKPRLRLPDRCDTLIDSDCAAAFFIARWLHCSKSPRRARLLNVHVNCLSEQALCKLVSALGRRDWSTAWPLREVSLCSTTQARSDGEDDVAEAVERLAAACRARGVRVERVNVCISNPTHAHLLVRRYLDQDEKGCYTHATRLPRL